MRGFLIPSAAKSKIGLIKVVLKEYVLRVNGECITCKIKTDKKYKNLSIKISEKSGVMVNNPDMDIGEVVKFLMQKSQWIYEKYNHNRQMQKIQEIYANEKKLLLMGEKITLHVKNIREFYKQKATQIIPNIVDECSKKSGFSYKDIRFRKTSRRWASCSYDNVLCFSPSVVALPIECIKYIVCHELVHVKHKHHKRAFYDELRLILPNYKDLENKIKNYSPRY